MKLFGGSIVRVVRAAILRRLSQQETSRPPSFFAVGEGGPPDASERVDEYVSAAVNERAGRRD